MRPHSGARAEETMNCDVCGAREKGIEDVRSDAPRVIRVIESFVRRGAGRLPDDPARLVRQYHTLEGRFLAEADPWRKEEQ